VRQGPAAAVAAGLGALVGVALVRPWLAGGPSPDWQQVLDHFEGVRRSTRSWTRWALWNGLPAGTAAVLCGLLATRQDRYDDVVARGMAGLSAALFGLAAGGSAFSLLVPPPHFGPQRFLPTTGDRVVVLFVAAAACVFAAIAWRAPRGASADAAP
jgi:hypothetical protein